MSIQERLNAAYLDTRITSATMFHVLGFVGFHGDDNGDIGLSKDGRPASDPEVIAEALGVTKSAVFKAFRRLEEYGYLAWDRARGNERATGVTGRVRLIVSA